jgi:hypothetical protein
MSGPAYTAQRRETMLFDLQSRVEADPWKAARVLWDELAPAPGTSAG